LPKNKGNFSQMEIKKRKGTRAKGGAFEKRCADILREYGWYAHISPPKIGQFFDKDTGEKRTYSAGQDIFGVIDILAKKPTLINGTVWIQCGEPRSLAKKKRDIAAFKGWCFMDPVFIFIKRPDRKIAVYKLIFTEEEPLWMQVGLFTVNRKWQPAACWQHPEFWGTRIPKPKKGGANV